LLRPFKHMTYSINVQDEVRSTSTGTDMARLLIV
jgi:hypothetical protein